jgi:hypothetical protein
MAFLLCGILPTLSSRRQPHPWNRSIRRRSKSSLTAPPFNSSVGAHRVTALFDHFRPGEPAELG